MKNYIIPENELKQIVATLENIIVSAQQGAILIQIAGYLKSLKEVEVKKEEKKETK